MSKLGTGTYQFRFNEAIPYESLPKLTNIDFITEKKGENTVITGFEIRLENQTENESINNSHLFAVKLSNLFTVKSNIPTSTISVSGEFRENDSTTVTSRLETKLTGKVFTKLSVTKEEIEKIQTNAVYNIHLALLGTSIKLLEQEDWASVIILLHVVMEENYDQRKDLSKYKFLRNALAHTKGDCGARKNVEKEFSADGFIFTSDDRFDYSSHENQIKLQKHASCFLHEVRDFFRKNN